MDDSLAVVRKHVKAGTQLDEKQEGSAARARRSGRAGYWGLLVDKQYGGSGAPFASFAPFLTQMAMVDPTVAGLASVHGCIGAVDPVRTFGNAEQKQRFLPRAGQRRAAVGVRADRAVRRLRPDGAAHHGRRSTATTTSSTARSCSSPTSCPAAPIGLVCLIDEQAGRADRRSARRRRTSSSSSCKYGLYALKHTLQPAASSSTTSACRPRTCCSRRAATA